jgi:hypothetical protein
LPTTEERVDLLECQVELLHHILKDPKHSHLNDVILERNLTRAEVNKIYGLMDMLSENPTAVDRQDFKSTLADLIPKYRSDPNFASSILIALSQDGKYENVYEYLKESDASLDLR